MYLKVLFIVDAIEEEKSKTFKTKKKKDLNFYLLYMDGEFSYSKWPILT